MYNNRGLMYIFHTKLDTVYPWEYLELIGDIDGDCIPSMVHTVVMLDVRIGT